MEQLTEIWQQFVKGEGWEWVFSGIGVPVVGWLLFRWWKKPESAPFTCNGGEQSVAQGKGAIGRQTNVFIAPLKPRVLLLVAVLLGAGLAGWYWLAPKGEETRVSTIGGGAPATVAGHDATVNYNTGISPEDFARYAGDLAVTDAALTNFFRILDEQQVPRNDLDAKLREIAATSKELQTELAKVKSEDPEVLRLKDEAKQAIEVGHYANAKRLLKVIKERPSTLFELWIADPAELRAEIKGQ